MKTWAIIATAMIAFTVLTLYFHLWHGEIKFVEVSRNRTYSERVCFIDSLYGPSGATATSLIPGHYSVRGHIDLNQLIGGCETFNFRFMIPGKTVKFDNSGGRMKNAILDCPQKKSSGFYNFKVSFTILSIEPYTGNELMEKNFLAAIGDSDFAYSCPSSSKLPESHFSSDGVLLVNFRLRGQSALHGSAQTLNQENIFLAPSGD